MERMTAFCRLVLRRHLAAPHRPAGLLGPAGPAGGRARGPHRGWLAGCHRGLPRLAFVAGVLSLGLLAACRPRPPAPPPRVPQVMVIRPTLSAVTNWDEYPGHLEAVDTVEIRSRVAGHLESIHFQDGSEVQAGQLLFTIDPRPYEAELERARAERRRAETQVALARNDFDRAARLRDSRAIAEEEYDARAKALRAAEDLWVAARAAEMAAELNLAYTRITAPLNGRIGRRLVAVGNMVQGSTMMPGTLLAVLVTQDPVYVYFDVPEEAFQRYRVRWPSLGNPGLEAVPCELGLGGEEGFPHRGRVDFVDNQADPRTGTIRLRGVFANPDRHLVPGMFARVRLPVEPLEQALLIPEAAILSEQTRKFVYVVSADGVVEARPVELGRAHGIYRIVRAGLGPEDSVVVSGLLMLRPGMKVQVLSGPTSSAGAPSVPPQAR